MKHGPSSLTVSLPRKWLDRFGLIGGDEIEIEDSTSKLIISSKKASKKPITFVYDMKGMHPRLVNSFINSIYKSGINDIRIMNVPSENRAKLKKILGERIGMEIIEESKSEIHAVYMGTSDEESLNKAEWQIYWKLLQMIDLALEGKSYSEIKEIDHELGKFAFFIQRNIRHKSSGESYSFLLYERISFLEGLGDAIKNYVRTKGMNKELLTLVKELIERLRVMNTKREVKDFMEFKKTLDNIDEISQKKGGGSMFDHLENLLQTNLAMYLYEIEESQRK